SQPDYTSFPYTTLFRSRPRRPLATEPRRPVTSIFLEVRALVDEGPRRVLLVARMRHLALAGIEIDDRPRYQKLAAIAPRFAQQRSEEHTSELQSRSDLV